GPALEGVLDPVDAPRRGHADVPLEPLELVDGEGGGSSDVVDGHGDTRRDRLVGHVDLVGIDADHGGVAQAVLVGDGEPDLVPRAVGVVVAGGRDAEGAARAYVVVDDGVVVVVVAE